MKNDPSVSVIEYGRPLCAGRPDAVLNNQRVIDAYLGTAVAR